MSSGSVHGINTNESFIANAALATKYTAVKLHTVVNEVVVAEAVTDGVLGFTQEEQATAGGAVPVRTKGYTLAIAGVGGWTLGDKLTVSTAGVLIATTTAGDIVCGEAMCTIAAGEIGEIKIYDHQVIYSALA